MGSNSIFLSSGNSHQHRRRRAPFLATSQRQLRSPRIRKQKHGESTVVPCIANASLCDETTQRGAPGHRWSVRSAMAPMGFFRYAMIARTRSKHSEQLIGGPKMAAAKTKWRPLFCLANEASKMAAAMEETRRTVSFKSIGTY